MSKKKEERRAEFREVKPENVDDHLKIITTKANLEKAKGARRLLYWCLIILLAIYVGNIFLNHFKITSELTIPLFELIKFLATSLAGYSFANGDLFSKE